MRRSAQCVTDEVCSRQGIAFSHGHGFLEPVGNPGRPWGLVEVDVRHREHPLVVMHEMASDHAVEAQAPQAVDGELLLAGAEQAENAREVVASELRLRVLQPCHGGEEVALNAFGGERRRVLAQVGKARALLRRRGKPARK